MSIKELIENLPKDEPYFSCEFFPPKTKSGLANLTSRIERMARLGPLWVNITWGAGGSTANKSLELARICQQLGVPTCLHLTCTNMNRNVLDEALERAKHLGIRSILALRGDPPRGQEYWIAGSGEFEHAVDLVRYIRKQYGDYFCVGVAAYPEGHCDGFSETQDASNDLPFLVQKVQAGADFIITQLFYDVDQFLVFEKLLREEPSGALKEIPVIPGLMPINTHQSFLRASKLSHASIPRTILKEVAAIANGDDETVKQYGVNLISSMIGEIRQATDGRIRGFHFYTLNLEKSVALILDKANLIKKDSSAVADETNEDDFLSPADAAKKRQQFSSASRKSSLATYNRVIESDIPVADDNADFRVDQESAAARTSTSSENTSTVLAISTGEGALGREATWDDFPNGRFGDSRSPAYGEIDGYGPTLHVDGGMALKLWGFPVENNDITNLFVRHIINDIDQIPFSDQSLSAETALIQEELIALNQKGYWTVASQPAGNAISSNDRIYGWGPKNGRVFQKSFVEFFVPPEEWARLKAKLDKLDDGEVSYFAATHDGKLLSKLPPGCHSNAVTWGVFPSREVVQSTIIEEESFLAWRDEAFGIWAEWQRLYPARSASGELLGGIHKNYYLVSIIHHDYFVESGLWDLLIEV